MIATCLSPTLPVRSALPARSVLKEPPLGDGSFSGEEIARCLSLMAHLGKVGIAPTRTDPEGARAERVEMEIILHGIVVLRAEARLDDAGLKRLEGLMAAASLLEW